MIFLIDTTANITILSYILVLPQADSDSFTEMSDISEALWTVMSYPQQLQGKSTYSRHHYLALENYIYL